MTTDRTDPERLDQLPEHERDDDVAGTSGGGILSEGGTAVDRGTGTLGGVAQGRDDEVEDADRPARKDPDTELDMSSIAYGAAARGSIPSASPTGVLPEAGFVPDVDDDPEDTGEAARER